MRVPKCQACKEQEAAWAWQPFGPGEDAKTSFILLGNHYRGFPVIKVCYSCKSAFETGDFPVDFTYKGYHFRGEDHQVKEVHINLSDGGSTRIPHISDTSATMIMKDGFSGLELVALVLDSEHQQEFVHAFVVAPGLLEACQELDKLRDKIDHYLDFTYVRREDRIAIGLALAKMHVAMESDK